MSVARVVVCLALWLIVAPCSAQDSLKPLSVDELLQRLSKESSAGQAAGLLAEHGSDPRTLPALTSAFINSTTKSVKESIALSMLRLQTKDPVYFDYLLSLASSAVEDNPPSLYLLREDGEYDYARSNPDFEEWCRAHGKNTVGEAQNQLKEFPGDLMRFSAAHDKRAAPVFRRGLASNNPLIKLICSYGLAGLQNPEDIGLLINAAESSKPNVEREIERALAMHYNNPRDRTAIAKRLKGSRLYEPYLKAVSVADRIEAQAGARNKQ